MHCAPMTTSALRATRRFAKQAEKWLQHSGAARRFSCCVRYAQQHPVVLTLSGFIALPVLIPFLVFIFVLVVSALVVVFLILTSLAGIFIAFLSVLLCFLFIFSLPLFGVARFCQISYCTIREAACYVQNLFIYVASAPSRMLHRLRRTLYEICSQLLEGISCDLRETFQEGKPTEIVEEKHQESDASELEDLEPDYRDREIKLYDALVQKQYPKGWETFEPFPYGV